MQFEKEVAGETHVQAYIEFASWSRNVRQGNGFHMFTNGA